MCGIAGFFDTTGIHTEKIQNVLTTLAQRGPDAQGWIAWDEHWSRSAHNLNPNHALLHTRLSIRDVSDAANQPMSNPEQTVWVCYNGEVYGWEEAVAELQQAGYVFRTRSDTEFILHGYQHWGIDGLIPRLRGMFALIILDLRLKRLWVFRDRLGLKPIVYYHGKEGFFFSSLVRALLPILPLSSKTVDPTAIDAYLAHRYIPAPLTLLKQLSRLESGHYLEYHLETHQLKKAVYWQPEADHSQPLAAVLSDSIRLRTVADRPVGLFLSGGVDSSVLASYLAKLAFRNITAFTAAFANSDMDESHRAKQIAAHFNLPFQAVTIPLSIRDEFEQIIADLDEPFADPSALPTWYLARHATQQVKVVLNGDGGDELFGGYKRYRQHLRSAFRTWRLPAIAMGSMQRKGFSKLWNELSMSWRDAYSLRFSGFTPAQRRYLQPDRALKAHYWRIPENELGNSMAMLLEIDRMNYLPEYILRKADLMTMAHGLEGRSPLLDHHLVNHVTGLAAGERFTQPAKKSLVDPSVFPEQLNPLKQKKQGFNPPLQHWLLNDLCEYHDGLGESLQHLTHGQIAKKPVDQLLNAYCQGHQAYAEQVLQLIVLRVSLQQYRGIL